MIKELMEDLLIEFDEMGFEPTTLCDSKKEIDSFRNRLKQVLDYLKAIEKSKPSEALECLLRFKNFFTDRARKEPDNPFNDKWLENIDIIKQALIKSQEQEKVLEILFEKNVDIIMIRMSETLDKYNRMIYKDNFNRKELTQEEFDLLKRYCNEI